MVMREKLKTLFCEWYYYGYWTHNKKLPFDISQSTFKAMRNGFNGNPFR